MKKTKESTSNFFHLPSLAAAQSSQLLPRSKTTAAHDRNRLCVLATPRTTAPGLPSPTPEKKNAKLPLAQAPPASFPDPTHASYAREGGPRGYSRTHARGGGSKSANLAEKLTGKISRREAARVPPTTSSRSHSRADNSRAERYARGAGGSSGAAHRDRQISPREAARACVCAVRRLTSLADHLTASRTAHLLLLLLRLVRLN